jgi:uncharacterized membrane protein YfcA
MRTCLAESLAIPPEHLLLVMLMGVYTGAQNFMAGGGTFIIFPVLLLLGLDPVTATMTSAMGLFPNQISSAHVSRPMALGVGALSLKSLVIISLVGGCIGSLLLVVTPSSFFLRLVPWLVLFATAIFAWGSLLRPNPVLGSEAEGNGSGRGAQHRLIFFQSLIAVYGGYFAAGIGFLMLAALTVSGQPPRQAIATKNVLVVVITAMSFVIFALSARVVWSVAIALAVGALAGSFLGAWLIRRIPNHWLKIYVVVLGTGLSLWLFLR